MTILSFTNMTTDSRVLTWMLDTMEGTGIRTSVVIKHGFFGQKAYTTFTASRNSTRREQEFMQMLINCGGVKAVEYA